MSDQFDPPSEQQLHYLEVLGWPATGLASRRDAAHRLRVAKLEVTLELVQTPGLREGQVWHHPMHGRVRIVRFHLATLKVTMTKLDAAGQPNQAFDIATLWGCELKEDGDPATTFRLAPQTRSRLRRLVAQGRADMAGAGSAEAGPSDAEVATYILELGPNFKAWAENHGVTYDDQPTRAQMAELMDLAREELAAKNG